MSTSKKTVKKTVSRTASKAAVKKSVAKKAPAKKTVAKKALAKKSPARKPAVKKAASKKATAKKGLTYAASGVDIHAGDKAVDMMKAAVKKTFTPRVLGDFGGFAGCFSLFNMKGQKNWKKPVLVGCTDGVGTKVLLAIEMKKVDTIGQDCVAMNVNDMIVSGATPLFFLDYIGISKVKPEETADIVRGVANACAKCDVALLGGETAEMPAVYKAGDFDLAGFAVGVAEEKDLISSSAEVKEGDVIIGLASSGVHSNGYSLVRAIVKHAKLSLKRKYKQVSSERKLGEVLLEPTRLYVKSVLATLEKFGRKTITGMSHITGSGLPGNLPRVLPKKLNARLYRGTWDIPGIFGFLQEKGEVSDAEMLDTFNMGLGYCMFVRPSKAAEVVKFLESQGEKVFVVGEVVKGKGEVEIV